MSTTAGAPRDPLRYKEPSSATPSLIGEPLLLPGEDNCSPPSPTRCARAIAFEELWVSEAVAKHWEMLRQWRQQRGFIATRGVHY